MVGQGRCIQGGDRARGRDSDPGSGREREHPRAGAGRGLGGAARLQARRVHDVPGEAGRRHRGPERRHVERRRGGERLRAALRGLPTFGLPDQDYTRGGAPLPPTRHC